MKFDYNVSYKPDLAFYALEFLSEAYESGTIIDIENMEDVLDALDISQDLEYLEQIIKDNYIAC